MDFHSINTLLVLAAVAGCVIVTVKLQGKIEFKSCIGYSKISKQTAALLPAAKNHSVVNIIGCKCRALIIHASLAQQAQENQSWFAGWRQGGLPGELPRFPMERSQGALEALEAKPSPWAAGTPQSMARLPLQMDSLSQKRVAGRAGRVKGTAILQFHTAEMESSSSQVTPARAGKWFYFLIAEPRDWRHTKMGNLSDCRRVDSLISTLNGFQI